MCTKQLIDLNPDGNSLIKVIGVGHTGINAVNHMQQCHIEGVSGKNTGEFSLQQLKPTGALQIENSILSKNDKTKVQKKLKDIEMLFLVTEEEEIQIISVLAGLAKELGILTVAIITTQHDYKNNTKVLSKLEMNADSIILISEKKLFSLAQVDLHSDTLETMTIPLNIVRSMTDPLMQQGLIGFDYADLKTLTKRAGYFSVGIGIASGKDRAKKATENATSYPLFYNIEYNTFYGILVAISGGNIGLSEFDEIGSMISSLVPEKTIIKIAMTHNLSFKNDIQVTLIATGIDKKHQN